MRATLDDRPLQHGEDVCIGYGRQAMADDDCGTPALPLQLAAQMGENLRFSPGVNSRQRIVEQQQRLLGRRRRAIARPCR